MTNLRIAPIQILAAVLCLAAPFSSRLLATQGRAAAMQASAAGASPFEGNWWMSAPKFEQIGYVEGQEDCDSFARGAAPSDSDAREPHRAFLNEFYSTDLAHRTVAVYDALHRAWPKLHDAKPSDAAKPDSSAAQQPELHGDFDGLFWRDTRRPERLGFLEGYLACYVHTAPRRRATYSKSPEEYLNLLDTWFHLTDREEDVDPKFENAKIADALYHFRDRRSRPHF